MITSFTKREMIFAVNANLKLFRPGFATYIDENLPIIAAIFSECHRGWDAGIRKTGINRTIEYLRWDTMLRESGSTFKISDQWTSSIARLWATLWPERAALFNYKEREGGVVRAPRVVFRAIQRELRA